MKGMRCVVPRSSSIKQRCINIISIFPFSDVTCLNCLTMNLFFKIYLFIDLFWVVLGLHCCTQAFSSCGKWGLLFLEVCGLFIAVASLVAEHRL